MAQKRKRVGRLANVGAKVRNINETVKLFGNFLSFNNFFAWFEGCSQFKSSGTGSLFRVDEPVPDDSLVANNLSAASTLLRISPFKPSKKVVKQ